MPALQPDHRLPCHSRLADRRRRVAMGACSLIATLALTGCGDPPATPPATIPLADAHAAAVNAITVSPFPGTSDASPTTQISFLGGPGTTVSAVHVVGSRSGTHSGELEAYSTGTGESFLVSRPFQSGEHVHVSAVVGSGGSAQTVHTSFSIAFQAPIAQQQFPLKPGDDAAVQHYLSAPTLTPSTVTITTPAQPGATPGDFFLAPYQGKGSPGPMIVSQSGQLIWFHPLPADESATNFQVQQYEGQPVLTWWQGRVLQLGFGQGEDEIYNTSYQPVAVVKAGNGYQADLHEVLLTPQGTAWIDAFDPVEMNLSKMRGSAHAVVSDGIVQEIDIKTGLVMWEWHAFGHIPLHDSHSPMPHTSNPWDYVHINSIDPGNSDDLLLSSRNTWALYDVSLHSGAIIWRLGGDYSSFKRGPGTKFYWQHDAAWQPNGEISVFDNGSSPPEEKQSRGLLLAPDLATRTVSLVEQFTNPTKTLLASSQGDLVNLGDGNWLMGYGGLPNFTEYNSAGAVLFDATLGLDVQDFRTYLDPWTGRPTTAPSIAAQAGSGGSVTVEASWNGATSVASWELLAGSAPTSLTAIKTVPETGFETTITATVTAPYVAVVALDSGGQTLGTSSAITPSS